MKTDIDLERYHGKRRHYEKGGVMSSAPQKQFVSLDRE